MIRALGKVIEDLQPGIGGADAWILDITMRYYLNDTEISAGERVMCYSPCIPIDKSAQSPAYTGVRSCCGSILHMF